MITERVFTAGVMDWGAQGVPEMLSALTGAGVTHLWDVRDGTTSGPFMSKWAEKNIRASCTAAGVEYVRRRNLGVPKGLREVLRGPGITEAEQLEAYAALLYGRGVDLGGVLADLLTHPEPALLCACRSGQACHRFLLADLLGVRALNVAPQATGGPGSLKTAK